MRELRRRGLRVRMINRSSRLRFEKDPQTELGGIDARNPVQTREVCEGASVVYHCVGLPYPRWNEFPAIADGIVEGAASANARMVYADNLYMYGPVAGPMTENLPNAATTRKGALRAKIAASLLAAHAAGRVSVSIGRGSDFFGPHATDAAMMGSRVFGRALAGKAAQVVGNPDRLHSYTFIDDFGRALVTLGERDEAQGGIWHVPSAAALTTREFVGHVFRGAGKPLRLSAAPGFAVRFLGMFDENMKELHEMLYQFESDFVLDSSKFERAFGMSATPHDAAIAATLDWFGSRSRR
jgi:nucleoside-diphosphate-sugar epimerase